MRYKILAKYEDNDWEEIGTAENESEADFLEQEYRLAFGGNWQFIQVTEDE